MDAFAETRLRKLSSQFTADEDSVFTSRRVLETAPNLHLFSPLPALISTLTCYYLYSVPNRFACMQQLIKSPVLAFTQGSQQDKG